MNTAWWKLLMVAAVLAAGCNPAGTTPEDSEQFDWSDWPDCPGDKNFRPEEEYDPPYEEDVSPDAPIPDADQVTQPGGPDCGLKNDVEPAPRKCAAWLAANRAAFRLNGGDTESCEAGTNGCLPPRTVTIDCGNARHEWCESRTHMSQVALDPLFNILIQERCQEAPAGCFENAATPCEERIAFCAPGGCVALEQREESECADIRDEVFILPHTAKQALCAYPDRICNFTGYSSCYTDECRNECPVAGRYTCLDGVPVREPSETLACEASLSVPVLCPGAGRDPDNLPCQDEGAICLESEACQEDSCHPNCTAMVCTGGRWSHARRGDYDPSCH